MPRGHQYGYGDASIAKGTPAQLWEPRNCHGDTTTAAQTPMWTPSWTPTQPWGHHHGHRNTSTAMGTPIRLWGHQCSHGDPVMAVGTPTWPWGHRHSHRNTSTAMGAPTQPWGSHHHGPTMGTAARPARRVRHGGVLCSPPGAVSRRWARSPLPFTWMDIGGDFSAPPPPPHSLWGCSSPEPKAHRVHPPPPNPQRRNPMEQSSRTPLLEAVIAAAYSRAAN